jgi:hypothetical protein
MELKNRIKQLFSEGILVEAKADISNILGKKKVLKGLGRKGVKKSKIKSKRKNNFKTQDARRILASKHGVSKALKKVKNKYVMTYAEIAKLMRHHSYVFNKDKGKWFKKKDTGNVNKSTPAPSSHKKDDEQTSTKQKGSSKGKTKVEKFDDLTNKLKSDKSSSIKPFAGIDVHDTNAPSKESEKSYQARLIAYILNVNMTEEGNWNDAIQIVSSNEQNIEFYLPKEKIFEYMDSMQFTWIEERKVWVDMDGNFPIADDNNGGRMGITCRALLANQGYVNFLDIEETTDEDAYTMAKELGYNWNNGMWIQMQAPMESIAARTFPELVTKDIIGKI